MALPYNLGKDTSSGSAEGITPNTIQLIGPFTAGDSGKIESMSLWSRHWIADNVAFTLGVFADSSGSPGALVGTSVAGNAVDGTWVTVAMQGSPLVVASSAYWLAIATNHYIGLIYGSIGGASTKSVARTYTSGVMPDPCPSVSNYIAGSQSVYATIVSAGGPAPHYTRRRMLGGMIGMGG